MSTTPSLYWRSGYAVDGDAATPIGVGDGAAVTLPAGCSFRATVLTIGSASVVYSITVLVDAGSEAFQLVTGTMSDLQVGMPVIPAIEAAPPAGLPNGLVITGVNKPSGGSIELGGFYPATSSTWVYAQPASETIEVDLDAIDQYPYGTLGVTVTPSTGVTVTDWSFDGTGDDNNIGNGTAMSNSGGQAMGTFGISFADAGTYTIEVAYTSFDPGYADATSSLTVTVP